VPLTVPYIHNVCISKYANIFQCAVAAVSQLTTAVSNAQTEVTEVKTGVTELTSYVRSNVSTGKL